MKPYIKTGKTIMKIGGIEVDKQRFHQHRKPISKQNVDVYKIVVSNKVSFGKKFF